MKTTILSFLALLLVNASAYAQTLKWTHTLVPPTLFQHDNAYVQHTRTDTLGNVCVIVVYQNASSQVGFRVLWLNSRGKVLRSADIPASSGFDAPRVVSISGSRLLICLPHNGGNQVLRRYSLRGTTVTESDLALNSTDYIPDNSNDFIINDATGFIVFSQSSGGNFEALKRYTVKLADEKGESGSVC